MQFNRRLPIVVGLVVLVGIGSFIVGRRRAAPEPETIRVERGTVTQEVIVTGRVESRDRADIAFDVPGTVQQVSVRVGDTVRRGQLLAGLDARLEALDVARAEATLASAHDAAQRAVRNADETLADIQWVNTATLDAKRQAVRNAKVELDQTEAVRQKELMDSGDDSLKSRSALLTLRKAETAYRTAQQTLLVTLADAEKTEQSAHRALADARAELAAVEQAAPGVAGPSALAAARDLARVHLNKTNLRAPFDGTVTAVEITAGEYAAPGIAVVTIETPETLELVADVPETDIVNLAFDQESTVRFDALRDAAPARATIARLDPAARTIEGVPTFRVTLELVEIPASVRPGMTADITITTAERRDVLVVPQRTVTSTEGRAVVRVLAEDRRIIERSVTVGLRGADGSIEITEGLREGEVVILRLPTEERASRSAP